MALSKNPGKKLYFSQFGGEQPIPPEFVAAMERKEERQSVANDVAAEPLSDTIVESRVETDRNDERVRRTVKKKAGNIGPLYRINNNDAGQPVQITSWMYPTGSTLIGVPSATTKVAVHDLGNGWSIEESAVEGSYMMGVFTPGIFTAALYAKERPNLVPERFRPAVPTVTTRIDEAGTAAAPTLSGDELRESQEQIDLYKKRTTIDTQAVPSLPVTLTGSERTEHGVGTLTRKYNTDGTSASNSFLVLRDQVDPLGDGRSEQEKVEVASFVTQTGQQYDPETGTLRRYTETRIATGSATGTAASDIQRDDFSRDIIRTYDLPAIQATLDAFVESYPGKASLSLPDELVGIDVVFNYSQGSGYDSHPATKQNITTIGTEITLSLSPRATAQGHASIVPEVSPRRRSFESSNVNTMVYEFYMPTVTTLSAVLSRLQLIIGTVVSSWPVFKPETVVLTLLGQSASVQASADSDVRVHLSGTNFAVSSAYGDAGSFDGSLTNRMVEIPATLHGSLSISAQESLYANASAEASTKEMILIDSAGVSRTVLGITNAPEPVRQTVTGLVRPTSIPATSPASVPRSGLYLFDLTPGKTEFERKLFTAEVVDMSIFA